MGRRSLTDCLLLMILLVGALGLGWAVPPAVAHDFLAAEMQPLDDESEHLRAMLVEIERQGQQRVMQLGRWIGWWTKIKDFATETGSDMMKSFDERLAKAEKAQSLLGGLIDTSPPGQRYLPHVGWHNVVTIGQLINTIKDERAKWAELIAKGKATWHIAAVGWITGEGIQKTIDDLEKQIRDINQGIRDGTFVVHIAGAGWVAGKQFRDRIAAIEQQKQAIRDRISAGEYEVFIPGLGPRTRKRIDEEIAGVEAELEKRRAIAAKGEMMIHRVPTGWQSLTQVQATLDADAQSYEVMKKTVNDGIYSVWIVETGYARRIDLEGRVQRYEETLEKTKDAIAKGDYAAHLPVGGMSSNAIKKAMEDLGKQLNQPNLEPKAREAIVKAIELHQKSLTELQSISAYDLAIIAMEKAEVTGLITGVMKLARPDFERREVVRTEKEETLAEYPIDLAIWTKPLELQLARLRQAKAWIPTGG